MEVPMIASYRDPRYAASLRIEHLRERAGALTEEIPAELRTTYARRVARSSAGAVALAGFAATGIASLADALSHRPASTFATTPTAMFLGAVVASLATYAITRAVAAIRFERRVRATFDANGDELVQLARLESHSVRRAAVRLASRGERASLALPLAGLGLLAPLAIHFVVFCVLSIGKEAGSSRFSSFDWWIGATLLLVGLAHLVLAYQAWRFASKVVATPTWSLEHRNPMDGWGALGWTVAGSLVPGLIAIAIPPVLVFLTGLVFVPASFRFMYRRALQERLLLEAEA
jgi:hypothetical protein